MEIYNKLKYALENREKIIKLYEVWKKDYNNQAVESMQNFIKI